MLRWLGPRKAQDSPDGRPVEASGEVTDDPLATIDLNRKDKKIYSVSRSVLLLPRIESKNGDGTRDKGGGG